MWIQISILTYSLQEKEWLINMKSFTLTKYSIKFYFVSDRQRYRLNLRCHGCGSITANQAIYDQNANHKSQGLLKNVIVITINCCAWCLSCSSHNPHRALNWDSAISRAQFETKVQLFYLQSYLKSYLANLAKFIVLFLKNLKFFEFLK